MTTLTVNVQSESDLVVLQKMLGELGMAYHVSNDDQFDFSEAEINSFKQTRQDYIDGKTTARDWSEIKKDLGRAFN